MLLAEILAPLLLVTGLPGAARIARPDDVGVPLGLRRHARLVARVELEEHGVVLEPQRVELALADPRGLFLVAPGGEQLVGLVLGPVDERLAIPLGDGADHVLLARVRSFAELARSRAASASYSRAWCSGNSWRYAATSSRFAAVASLLASACASLTALIVARTTSIGG